MLLLPVAAVALGWYLVVPDQQQLKATGQRLSRAQIDLQTVLQNHELWQRVNSLKYLTWEVFVRRSFHRGTWVQCADATGNELLRQERSKRTTSLADAIEKECGPAPRF
ncbi:MAG: hypothetical protein RLZZ32_1050 [Cyanobacteriota bacterium]|jgi:hypothetical protein